MEDKDQYLMNKIAQLEWIVCLPEGVILTKTVSVPVGLGFGKNSIKLIVELAREWSRLFDTSLSDEKLTDFFRSEKGGSVLDYFLDSAEKTIAQVEQALIAMGISNLVWHDSDEQEAEHYTYSFKGKEYRTYKFDSDTNFDDAFDGDTFPEIGMFGPIEKEEEL